MQTASSQSVTSLNTKKPDKGPGHQYLEPFVGHWKVAGENGPNAPDGKNEKVVGEEIYEWLDGKFFLVNRFERQSEKTKFTGMGWLGYDASAKIYRSYSISNSGYLRVYEVQISDHQIYFIGVNERATMKLSSEGDQLNIFWEILDSEKNWQLLCQLVGQRL